MLRGMQCCGCSIFSLLNGLKSHIFGPKNPFCCKNANLPNRTCFTRIRGGGGQGPGECLWGIWRARGHFTVKKRPLFDENAFVNIHSKTREPLACRSAFQKKTQKNPHAHKNTIGTSTPPLPRNPNRPPQKEEFYGHVGFSRRKNQKCQEPIKII